jgi:hypothetical protein
MSAITVLTFPQISAFPQTCCKGFCGHAETHIPLIRTPVVSARWTVEPGREGTGRLVERWFINQNVQK